MQSQKRKGTDNCSIGLGHFKHMWTLARLTYFMTDVILLQVMKIEIFGERKNNKDTKNTKGNQLKHGPN